MKRPEIYHPSICYICYVKCSDILYDYYLPNGERYIQLKTGLTWQHINFQGEASLSYEDEGKQSKLSFNVPGTDVLFEIEQKSIIDRKEYVICFKDHTGRWKLIGHKESGLRIKRTFTNDRQSIISKYKIEYNGLDIYAANGPVLPRECLYKISTDYDEETFGNKNSLIIEIKKGAKLDGAYIYGLNVGYGGDTLLINYDYVEYGDNPTEEELTDILFNSFTNDEDFTLDKISDTKLKLTYSGLSPVELSVYLNWGQVRFIYLDLKAQYVEYVPPIATFVHGGAGSQYYTVILEDVNQKIEIYKNQQWVEIPYSRNIKIENSIDTIEKYRIVSNDIVIEEDVVQSSCKIQ